MDVKMTAGSQATSGGGAIPSANGTVTLVNQPTHAGFVTYQLLPPAETIFEIPAKKHSFRLIQQGDNIWLDVAGVEGTYGGKQLLQLLHDLQDVVSAADQLLDAAQVEEDEIDEDEVDEDNEAPTDSEEVPPPPAIRAQADGATDTFGFVETPKATFCPCADCSRRRI